MKLTFKIFGKGRKRINADIGKKSCKRDQEPSLSETGGGEGLGSITTENPPQNPAAAHSLW
jgi:hypothetical protein